MYMDFSKTIYIKENDYLDGRSIVIFDCDSSFVLTKQNHPHLILHIIQIFNDSMILSKKQSNINEFCVMVNLTNISKCKLSIKFLVHMTTILKNAFQDKLYKCFLQHPTMIFRSIYLVIRNVIDKETKKKIIIVKNGNQIIYDTIL